MRQPPFLAQIDPMTINIRPMGRPNAHVCLSHSGTSFYYDLCILSLFDSLSKFVPISSRQRKVSTYKERKGEPEFLKQGAHDRCWCSSSSGQSVDDVDGKPDKRRLGVADCCPTPLLNSFILEPSRHPSDRVIGYL